MILADYHLHTSFSEDSDTPCRQQAEAELAAGMTQICITDHDDPGYPDHEFDLDLDLYYPSIQALSRQYRDRLRICTGIELGLRTDCADTIREHASRYPWDFIIGSTHVVDGIDPYYPAYWKDKSVKEAISRYYEVTLDNIRSFDCFDVYGHIDYIVRYIPKGRTDEYRCRDYTELLEEILIQLIRRGKGIECNTAGFKYGLNHPNPEEALLSRYFELGGTILTVGSDGHRPEHVAWDFNRLPRLLKACGACEYTVFEGRRPRQLPL